MQLEKISSHVEKYLVESLSYTGASLRCNRDDIFDSLNAHRKLTFLNSYDAVRHLLLMGDNSTRNSSHKGRALFIADSAYNQKQQNHNHIIPHRKQDLFTSFIGHLNRFAIITNNSSDVICGTVIIYQTRNAFTGGTKAMLTLYLSLLAAGYRRYQPNDSSLCWPSVLLCNDSTVSSKTHPLFDACTNPKGNNTHFYVMFVEYCVVVHFFR